MKNLFCLLLLLPTIVFGQDPVKKLATTFENDRLKPMVLLLGVFHFAGEQVDASTTSVDLRVDKQL